MINLIWQTRMDNISVLGDETNGQYEFITKVILKNVDYINYFDNKKYETILDNSIIVYSAPGSDIDSGLKDYLNKYNELKYNYILLHISNETLNHKCEYYSDAQHVFRFYHDEKIKKDNVTTLPLGFVSGYMNNTNNINLSDKRDISVVFIGQVKSDRKILVESIKNIENNFLHLTNKWNCPTKLSFDDVIDIYKRTLFVPCPMGWCNPDSLRIFESLEWGCIPIIKKYNGIDYFEYIFGEHPIPTINEWTEVKGLMDNLINENIDDLILSINKWYKNYMNSVSENVSDIIYKKIKNK